jgi:hypothetical protein
MLRGRRRIKKERRRKRTTGTQGLRPSVLWQKAASNWAMELGFGQKPSNFKRESYDKI